MSASAPTVPIPYRPLAFGKKYSVKPRNVADITTRDIIRFVRNALRGTDVLELLQSRVDHQTGRPRPLRVDVLFAAGIANAAGKQSDSHVRGIHGLLASLDPGDQRLLGVRWVDQRQRYERVVSERQVAYLFEEVARAFNPDLHNHDHMFELDGNVWAPDGEFLAPVMEAMLPQGALDCTESCPRGPEMEAVFNAILRRLWDYTGMPLPDGFALDSAVIETHNVTRGHGPKANIDPDWVQDVDKDNVGDFVIQRRKDKRPKQATDGLEAKLDEILATLLLLSLATRSPGPRSRPARW